MSQSAVSRAFTPGASISDLTRMRILEAAEAIGYRPNALARSLISGRSRLIGLILSTQGSRNWVQALELLSRALQQRGYYGLVFLAGGDEEGVERVLDDLVDYQVDGILLGSLMAPARSVRRCAQAGVPVIQFGTGRAAEGTSAILFDERAGGLAVAEHLVAGGHLRMVHLALPGGAAGERGRGFAEGLARHGLAPAQVIEAEPARAAEAARALFAGRDGERPDAVFCDADHLAFPVLDMLRRELGVRVPEEVSVVGFDDAPKASCPAWDLTTVRLDPALLVERTLEALLALLTRRAESRSVRLDCPLIVRGSSRRPAT